MKKIISIILTLVIILTAIHFAVIPVSSAASGTTGDCTWSLNGTVLTISGNGKMKDYDYNYYYQAPWGKSITEVIIEDGVTSIGEDAFYSCSSLTSITIPDSVTSVGFFAFYNCSKLTKVNITDISAWCNIDFVGDYSNPLSYAKNLYLNDELVTDLVIPDGITKIKDYAFYNCSFLSSITIPNSVTSIGDYAFDDCSSLTSITIPNGVTSIGVYAFDDCSSLTSITIPNSVTSIGVSAFRGCSSLEEITLPFVGSTLNGVDNTHFGYIFYYVDLDGYKYNSYKSNKNIPSSLKKVTITGGYAIDEYAFDQCNYIEEVIISDTTRSIYSYAFEECKSLKSVTIPQSVINIYSTAFNKCDMLTINCVKDSNAEQYAKSQDITYAYITAFGKVNGDVNGDGKVDTTDLAVLKLHLAGM